MRHHIALLASTLVLIGCATTDGDSETVRGAAQFADDPRLGEQVDRICFASSIDSFGETTRDTIVLREGKDYYLVEVFGGCQTMDHAQSVGFDTFSGCLTKGDHLIVSESISPSHRTSAFDIDKCLVNAMYEWDPDAEATEDDTDATDDDAGEQDPTET